MGTYNQPNQSETIRSIFNIRIIEKREILQADSANYKRDWINEIIAAINKMKSINFCNKNVFQK
jgi:hypothetical protein